MNLNSSITEIKGIGQKTADSFAKLGVYTVSDILLHFPRTYIQFPVPLDGDKTSSYTEGKQAVLAQVKRAPVTKNTRRMQITLLSVGQAPLQLIWYRMPYVRNTLIPGKHFVFYGKIIQRDGGFVMEQPVIYSPKDYEEIQERFLPVYGLTSGITNRLMSKTLQSILGIVDEFPEYLPQNTLDDFSLYSEDYAFRQIHFPDSMDTLVEARKRLVFDEFFTFLLGVQYQKSGKKKEKSAFFFKDASCMDELIKKLPFSLTEGQQQALCEIRSQMLEGYVMQRLIQGDVGSGKTILAFLVMAWTAHNGYQSAIMAPTEVLAKQHYETFQKLCEDFSFDYEVVLLTGSMTASQKKKAYQVLENSTNAMVIGTHALIQDKAVYSNLALVITDEQHRFGVNQREVFSKKGNCPHILVMSATPIPRTLAIILYGDMDLSVIRDLPAKRLPIKNCVIPAADRPKAYRFISEQLRMGHQAYVICPLVEESENMEGENVQSYAAQLKEQLPEEFTIEIMHGKLKSEKKNHIMEDFAGGKIQVLVSTTVVEVGVNVPNATVMMIENADHFGLAQLHQLRGRVGRGESQSYCIMINTSDTPRAKKRLEILNHSNDGFFIASEDLKLRGPGDFFGIRQSGEMDFKIADIYQDADILQMANQIVSEVLEEDPQLEQEKNSKIKDKLMLALKEQWNHVNL